MPEKKAHPLNCEGPFYVEHGCCLTCDLPRTIAPDMFDYTAEGDHCYVFQQPRTEDQVKRMITAMESADLQCVRCRSRDPKLLRLLKKKELKNQCDFSPMPSRWGDFWFTVCMRVLCGGVLGAAAGLLVGFDWRGWPGILWHLARGDFRWVILWFSAWALGGVIIAVVKIPYWQRPWYKGLQERDEDDGN